MINSNLPVSHQPTFEPHPVISHQPTLEPHPVTSHQPTLEPHPTLEHHPSLSELQSQHLSELTNTSSVLSSLDQDLAKISGPQIAQNTTQHGLWERVKNSGIGRFFGLGEKPQSQVVPSTPSYNLDNMSLLEWKNSSTVKRFDHWGPGYSRSHELQAIDTAYEVWANIRSTGSNSDKAEAIQSLLNKIQAWETLKGRDVTETVKSKRAGPVTELKKQAIAQLDRLGEAIFEQVYRDAGIDPEANDIPALHDKLTALKLLKGRSETAEVVKGWIDKIAEPMAEELKTQQTTLRDGIKAQIIGAPNLQKLKESVSTIQSTMANPPSQEDLEKLKTAMYKLGEGVFNNFMNYAHENNFVYALSTPQNTDLLAGSKKGACSMFAGTFNKCFKELAEELGIELTTEIPETGIKGFITKPLGESYVDRQARGNIVLEGDLPETRRYFFTSHYVSEVSMKIGETKLEIGCFDPTSGQLSKTREDLLGKIVETGYQGFGKSGSGYLVETRNEELVLVSTKRVEVLQTTPTGSTYSIKLN